MFLLKKAGDFISGAGNRSPSAFHKPPWAGSGIRSSFVAEIPPHPHVGMLLDPSCSAWGREERRENSFTRGSPAEMCQAGDFSPIGHANACKTGSYRLRIFPHGSQDAVEQPGGCCSPQALARACRRQGCHDMGSKPPPPAACLDTLPRPVGLSRQGGRTDGTAFCPGSSHRPLSSPALGQLTVT